MLKAISKFTVEKCLPKFNLNNTCRLLSSICGPKEAPKYRLRMAYPPDYMNVLNFMSEEFLRNEPTMVNMGGGLVDKDPDPAMLQLTLDEIKNGMTIICEDYRTKCIAGAALNTYSRYSSIEEGLRMAECCQIKEAGDVLRFYAWCSKEADPWNNFCVDGLFECANVAVGQCYQKQGIARRLIEESWILARDLNFRLFRIDGSSAYTSEIAKSYGWKCIFQIPYGRYVCETGEFVFKNITPPHCDYAVFVDDLSYTVNYRLKQISKERK